MAVSKNVGCWGCSVVQAFQDLVNAVKCGPALEVLPCQNVYVGRSPNIDPLGAQNPMDFPTPRFH